MAKVFCFFFLLLSFLPQYVQGADIEPEISFCSSADRTLAWINFTLPAEYHAYGHKPGPAGIPTSLDFVLEDSGGAHVFYPQGVPEPDSFDRNVIVNIYKGQIGLLAVLPAHVSGKIYVATLKMLLCNDRHCLPFDKKFTGNVPEKLSPLSEMPWHAQAALLLDTEDDSSGALSLEEGAAPPSRSEPAASEKREMAPRPEIDALPEDDEYDFRLTPRPASGEPEIYTLGKALLLGLIAGLLLNAMPCVLPVLTLKISGLLLLGGSGKKQKLREFRIYNISFAAGILTLFTVLAILLSIADLMWGQLFQSQALILVMLLIVFLMGLSMLGVFILPAFDLKIGEHASSPFIKSYCAGLVSTFLATPCSGPLLGGVLAWSFTQPLAVMIAVFWSVGLGMGLPYILFSIWPGFARILPRPGEWMILVERILGFLLLATSLYLVYVLPSEKRMGALALLLTAGFCAWLWGEFCGINAPRLRRWLGGITTALILSLAFWWTLRPEPPSVAWQPFTVETFAADLGRKKMLVEFTADWCPNCKFLEASVLTDKNLRAWQKKYGFNLIRVDLTRSNPVAEKLLAHLGSKSIPLTALFPAGPGARAPVVLRDLYSADKIKQALGQTF